MDRRELRPMATAASPVHKESATVLPIAAPSAPAPRRRSHWVKWASAIGLAIELAVIWQLWRTHSKRRDI